MERRYDMDWVRVIAIGLLLIYHVAIGFQPWGVLVGFITNQETLDGLWAPMSFLNVWRIPLLFFVSGMGVCFAMRRRNWKQLFQERTRRILLPLLFGIAVISPIHVAFMQNYYAQQVAYVPNAGHLWFLGNLFTYVQLCAPLFYLMYKYEQNQSVEWTKRAFSHPIGFAVILGGFVLEVRLVNPAIFELYAMTWHGVFLGFVAFLFGFLAAFTGQGFWSNVVKWRYPLLVFGLGLFMLRMLSFSMKSPNELMAAESVFWILTVFGFTSKYLNRPSKALSYLSQGVYPIYIIHMAFLYLASWLIFPIDLQPWLKFVLVVILTFTGCLLTYEFVIRRVRILRPLFGLNY